MNELFNLALADNGQGALFTQHSKIHGRGLFTSRDLPAKTILCRRLGVRSMISLRDKRAIIGIDGFDPGIPEDIIFKHINHSCHPNAYFSDTACLISLEMITSGDEITVDYNTLLSGSSWTANCKCGLPDCRKIIGRKDD